MPYQVTDDSGKAIDAHFDIDGPTIVFHSSGGTKSKDPRNLEYNLGLKILLGRIQKARLKIEDAWIDNVRGQDLSHDELRIVESSDLNKSPDELVVIMGRNMQKAGRSKTAKSAFGNYRKRIRIKISGGVSDEEMAQVLKGKWVDKASKGNSRLGAADFEAVDEGHIWDAVEKLRSGKTSHNFGDSTGYDLICEDGARLDPKAVFGVAAEAALGREVSPEHFESGQKKQSHKKLKAAGYAIVQKGAEAPKEENFLAVPDDQEWAEGKPKRVTHLKRERSRTAAKAKRAQFIRQHGRLFCERCKFEPSEKYGDAGEACIEVHHTIPLAKVKGGQSTRLDDLQCLCANCHRVVHREMRSGAQYPPR